MSKPKPTPAYNGPMLPIGTKVMVLRPNLWAGHSGEVVRYFNDRPLEHCVRIQAKDGDGYFHCAATIDELKEIKP